MARERQVTPQGGPDALSLGAAGAGTLCPAGPGTQGRGGVARRLLWSPSMNNPLRSLLLGGVMLGVATSVTVALLGMVPEPRPADAAPDPVPEPAAGAAYLVDVYVTRPHHAAYAVRLGVANHACATATDNAADQDQELKACAFREGDGAVRAELEVSQRARNERDWVRQRFELEGRMAPDGVARVMGAVSSPEAPVTLQVALRPQGGENTDAPLLGACPVERE